MSEKGTSIGPQVAEPMLAITHEANPERPRLIMTIRGEGYKFNG